jgi:hypothetical protein
MMLREPETLYFAFHLGVCGAKILTGSDWFKMQ